MSEDLPHEFHTSEHVRFLPGTGFVGMRTVPGAAAQVATGLVFEAETQLDERGETFENVWVKAVLGGDADSHEYLLFATDAARIEPLVSALAEAATGHGSKLGTTPAGLYDGYHNRAQIDFSDAVTEECVGNLIATVTPTRDPGGVEFALRDRGQQADWEKHSRAFSTGGRDAAVTRLNAGLDGAAVTALLTEFSKLKAWQESMRQAIARHLADNPASPAPGR